MSGEPITCAEAGRKGAEKRRLPSPTRRVTLHLYPDQADWLRQTAQKEGLSTAEFARRIVQRLAEQDSERS